ncbi:unnamed protein product [Spirodela intermedia]|uniref:Uncharacterized protein n=1 Tax=Spirodela intermedia TaxID=51605 RepID=A0A7I8L780_SPIIN|nr:unnamed protein product [Spirodela intermedia]
MSKIINMTSSATKIVNISNYALELSNIPNEFKLNGRRLLQWYQLIKVILIGKDKLDHLLYLAHESILEFKGPLDVLLSYYSHVKLRTNLISRGFGCVAYVHNQDQAKGKLDPRALKFVKMDTIRILLSLAANYDWDIQQFDVKDDFVHK